MAREVAVTERVLFGLVANRALAPSSKLAAAEWITNGVYIENLGEIGEQACYRAMDWLHHVRERLEVGVFDKVATLLNLEVDLLFFDTTSTISNSARPISRSPATIKGPGCPTASRRTRKQRRPGSAPRANPRTPGMICRRS